MADECRCRQNACGCHWCIQNRLLMNEMKRIIADSAYGKEGHVLGRMGTILYRYDGGQLTTDHASNITLPTQQASEDKK